MSFEPGRYRVSALSIRILTAPDYEATLDDQAIFGEEVDVLEVGDEFAKVHARYNGKIGWVPAAAQKLVLLAEAPEPTHRARLPRTVTFRKPDPTSETMVILPLNAQLALGDREIRGKSEFARILGLSVEAWVRTNALAPLGQYERDFVAVQESLAGHPYGTPYVWGARDSTLGMDCSGLLSTSLRAAGYDFCPRDTKEQVCSSWLGKEIPIPPRGYTYERGDLVFWKGHVATMVDRDRCIHATDMEPYHCVLIQKLDEVIRERALAGKGTVTCVRRFDRYRRENLKGLVA